MRILFDGQCFHLGGDSRVRGIGRYSAEMLEQFARVNAKHEATVLYGSEESFDGSGFDTCRSLHVPFVQPLEAQFNEILLEFCCEVGGYDVVHVLSPAEPSNTAVPNMYQSPNSKLVVTLFDLIPLIFSEHYLRDSATRDRYMRQLEIYRKADHIVSISHASKADAVRLLGLDPGKITVLPPSRPSFARPPMEVALNSRQGEKYALYTGGDDFRKNLDAMLEGLAIAASPGNSDFLLKIVCKLSEDSRQRLLALARRLGIEARVQLLGYVSDQELVALYANAYLFIFPSLYEGLGLPILEAMSFDCPVLSSNTSSMPEILGGAGLLFDPTDPTQIGEALAEVWANEDLRDKLSRQSRQRYENLQFDSMGSTLIEAYEGLVTSRAGELPKVAIVSPWPPKRSGVADYAASLEHALQDHVGTERVSEDLSGETNQRILDSSDIIIVQMGNSEYHDFVWSSLDIPKEKTITILHDVYLSGYWYHNSVVTRRDPRRFVDEMIYCHGRSGGEWAAEVIGGRTGFDASRYPMNKRILDASELVIVHSEWARERLVGDHPWVHVLPLPVDASARGSVRKPSIQGVSGQYVIGVYGHVASTKLPHAAVRACASLVEEGYDLRLVFIGEAGKEMDGSLKKLASNLRVGERVEVTGYMDETTVDLLLCEVDVAINLRHPYGGESSASLSRLLAGGIPTIVSDVGSFSEIPSGVVEKIPPGPDVEGHLRPALKSLLDHPSRRNELSNNALSYATALSWSAQTPNILSKLRLVLTLPAARRVFDAHVRSKEQALALGDAWARCSVRRQF